MFKKIASKFNMWYDGLQEPWRMLMALALAAGPVYMLATGVMSAMILGAIFVVLLICVRAEAA